MGLACDHSAGEPLQAFTIRQLKSNPFTVIRAAEADAMALVTNRDQPTALVVALDRLGVADTAAVRSGLALTLIQSGSISTAAAARIAGLPLPHFLELLSSLRLPLSSSDPADTCSDLEALKNL